MLGRRPEPGGHQQGSQFVAVQRGGMRLVIQPRPADNLEEALGLPMLPPLYAPRDELQQRLDAVLAEQDERERIRHANS